jgi:hypothetical protein
MHGARCEQHPGTPVHHHLPGDSHLSLKSKTQGPLRHLTPSHMPRREDDERAGRDHHKTWAPKISVREQRPSTDRTELLLYECGKSVHSFPEVYRPCCDQNPDAHGRNDHAIILISLRTVASVFPSTVPRTRTTTDPNRISINDIPSGRAGAVGSGLATEH